MAGKPRSSKHFILSLFYADCWTLGKCLKENNTKPYLAAESLMLGRYVSAVSLREWLSARILPAMEPHLRQDNDLAQQVRADKERVEALFSAWSSTGSLTQGQKGEAEQLAASFGALAVLYGNQSSVPE